MISASGLLSFCARLVGFAGAVLAAAGSLGWLWFFFFSHFSGMPDWNVGILPLITLAQVLVAAWVARGALVLSPGPLLRVLLIASFGAFLLGYGWYMLLVGFPLALIGIGDLLYLAASFPAGLAVLAARTERRFEDGGAASPTRGASRAARSLGAISLLAVAAASLSYGMTPPPPEAEAADLSDNPPISCAPGVEELRTFRGPGDQTTSAFEVGPNWGFAYSSAGLGSFGVGIISEEPAPSYLPEDLPPEELPPVSTPPEMLPAGGVGGGEVASEGTFRLEIKAEGGVEYEVLLCDGHTGPVVAPRMEAPSK